MFGRIVVCIAFCLVVISPCLPDPATAAERRTVIVDAVAKARRAVVNIRTEKIVQRRRSSFFGFGDSMFDQFFRDMMPPQSYKTQSLGSGVIIDDQGHILTNAHVVDKASRIFVALSDRNRELEAMLIGSDERIDLAVLKIIDDGEYPFLSPAGSDDLMLGETIIAIGNPLGLGHSITTGIISSLDRRIQIDSHLSSVFIQTDALINPGNSGGPLININGELIGINTAIARQAQGIGFSIPIDTAKRVVTDLIEYGRVRRGFVGLLVGDVSGNFVRSFGEGGVLVDDIIDGAPAQQAGFQLADVIFAVNGISVADTAQYHSLLRTYPPGNTLEFDVLRGNRKILIKATLRPLPDGYEITYTRQVFGFEIKESKRGVIVTQVLDDSAAEKVGIKRGDYVARVDGIQIESMADFSRVIEDSIGRKPLSFTIVRDNVGYRIQLP